MNGKQLKNSILQWAIQGKLVPQDPNDEPASVLLERIRAEKAKLIKEKKIKKDKNESIIYRGDDNSYYEKFLATGEVKCIDEEIPFEIPTTWEWVRLNSYSDVRDGTHDTPHYVTCGYPLVTSKDFISGKFDFSKTKYIDEQTFVEINKRSNVQIGDILFSMIGGNIGSMILITRENYFDMAIKNVALFKQYIYDEIIIKYLCFYLQSQIISIKSTALGGAQSFVPLNILRNYLMPIPPLSEQQRIVSKLEEILPLVETYERSQNELNSLNAIIYEQLRKSILQETIQGKLIPQISEEGTGKELLTEIHKEKERLVKEGKLKKSALTDSVIFKGDDNKYWEKVGKELRCIDDEIHFEIPASWQWVRIKDIFQINPKNIADDNCISAFIPMEKICATYGSEFSYDEVQWKTIKTGYTHFADGDVVFAKITPCFQNRKSAIFIGLPNGIGAGTTELKVMRPYGETINRWYLLYFLKSPYFIDEAQFKGTANQQRIITGYLENKLFPLPPKSEQDRIVQQIKQLASIMSR